MPRSSLPADPAGSAGITLSADHVRVELELDDAVARVDVARQPLFDRRGRVGGYELLYRATSNATGAARSDSVATSSTIVTAFMELGLSTIVGTARAWINVTEDLLCSDLLELLPPERVVLEVLETIEPTVEVMGAIDHYRALGYRLALDDVDSDPASELVARVHALKLDLRAIGIDRIEPVLRALPQGSHELVIEKVETHEELEYCRSLGFDLYQGWVFGRPELASGKRLSSATLARVQLVAALRDSEVELSQLEQLVLQDVTLSYRLLTFINSAHVALPRRVESMREAIVLLGLHKVRNWATLLLLTDMDPGRPDLVESSVTRARMCELLATEASLRPDTAFTVGLLSRLDALLGVPLAQILDGLPLAAEVSAGLLGTGAYGTLLDDVSAYERGDFELARLPADDLATAYREAAADLRSGIMYP